jgi:hypothetical protein
MEDEMPSADYFSSCLQEITILFAECLSAEIASLQEVHASSGRNQSHVGSCPGSMEKVQEFPNATVPEGH